MGHSVCVKARRYISGTAGVWRDGKIWNGGLAIIFKIVGLGKSKPNKSQNNNFVEPQETFVSKTDRQTGLYINGTFPTRT